MTGAGERLRRRQEVRVEAVEDGLVAQSADGQAVHLLNRTAAFIWERCDGARTAEEIAGELAAETDEGLERVRADVAATLADLRDKGLLE